MSRIDLTFFVEKASASFVSHQRLCRPRCHALCAGPVLTPNAKSEFNLLESVKMENVMDNALVIAGGTYRSRLIVGTGKYSSMEAMEERDGK
jgi:hypothetical protein